MKINNDELRSENVNVALSKIAGTYGVSKKIQYLYMNIFLIVFGFSLLAVVLSYVESDGNTLKFLFCLIIIGIVSMGSFLSYRYVTTIIIEMDRIIIEPFGRVFLSSAIEEIRVLNSKSGRMNLTCKLKKRAFLPFYPSVWGLGKTIVISLY